MNTSIIFMQTAIRNMQTACTATGNCSANRAAQQLMDYLCTIVLMFYILLVFAAATHLWNITRDGKKTIPIATVISIVCVVINIGILIIMQQ